MTSALPFPPTTETELLGRAEALAGCTIGASAATIGADVPENLRRHKGFVGQLLEQLLGADAANRSEPDFRRLGIELKTLPVTASGVPRETTFVCTVPVLELQELTWENSRVLAKLSRVLWIPVLSDEKLGLAERKIGSPILWSPTEFQLATLHADWEEHMAYIRYGQIDAVTAHQGTFLQVRPKARNSLVRRDGVAGDSATFHSLPRGYYLRTCLTRQIIQNYLSLR